MLVRDDGGLGRIGWTLVSLLLVAVGVCISLWPNPAAAVAFSLLIVLEGVLVTTVGLKRLRLERQTGQRRWYWPKADQSAYPLAYWVTTGMWCLAALLVLAVRWDHSVISQVIPVPSETKSIAIAVGELMLFTFLMPSIVTDWQADH